MPQSIVYEHPLHERIRTFLRLEHLWQGFEHFLAEDTPWASRAAVGLLLDMLGTTARADVKADILKELERNLGLLRRLSRQPGVDMTTLSRILEELERTAGEIYGLDGQLGHKTREDELIKSIAQRASIPGGTCSFDLPQYHQWLSRPHPSRRQQLEDWAQDLKPVCEAVALLLSLVRGSSEPQPTTASEGFFQDAMDTQAPIQMLRIALDEGSDLYPEVSGHKHRFSIRFLQTGAEGRPIKTDRDVTFLLTRCVI